MFHSFQYRCKTTNCLSQVSIRLAMKIFALLVSCLPSACRLRKYSLLSFFSYPYMFAASWIDNLFNDGEGCSGPRRLCLEITIASQWNFYLDYMSLLKRRSWEVTHFVFMMENFINVAFSKCFFCKKTRSSAAWESMRFKFRK